MTREKEWIIKHDFEKLDTDVLKDNIEYIFNATVDIILSIHTKKGAVRTSSHQKYCLNLKQEEVPIYEKADITSKIVATTPKGLMKVDCDYVIMGLEGDAFYWRVSDFKNEPPLYGFIHGDFVEKE